MNRFIKVILALTKKLRYAMDPISFKFTSNRKKLDKMKSLVNGRPLLIVGNGPSLNETPLDEFSAAFSIGMNKIDLIFQRTDWRPDIIVTQNSLVVRQHWKSMRDSGIPQFLSWNSRWMMPFGARKNFNFFLTRPRPDFQKNVAQAVGASGTVTYAVLQFAYHLGANPVILVGVDHNFTYTDSPNDYQKREGKDVNHFDPNYFAEGQYWGVPNLDASEIGFQLAKAAFEADGRVVYDATINGKLRVFEKISIEQAKSFLSNDSQ